MTNLATIVLAAGEGRRFDGVKQIADVGGHPALARVLNTLDRAAARQIVVLGAHAKAVEPVVPAGWEVVRASDWAAGPGASLRAALAAACASTAALVVLGDLPWLDRRAVDRVLDAADRSTLEVVRAFESGAPGHPLFLRGNALEAARRAPDEGMKAVLADLEVKPVDCTGLGVAKDVDRRADIDRD
jgi:nicotine blue oxidoreductase